MFKYGTSQQAGVEDRLSPPQDPDAQQEPPSKKMRSNMYDNETPEDDVEAMEEVAPIGNFAPQIEIEYKAFMAYKTEEEQNNIKKLDGGDFRVLT
jgi:hypothetical protein